MHYASRLYPALAAGLLLLSACGGGTSATGSAGSTVSKATATHGTVTGFGSVIVDGVRYDTSKARFKVDNVSGRTQDDLNVGQRVSIVGRKDDRGNYVADDVEYDAELNATITAIDTSAGIITALGQTIRIDAATVFFGVADLSALALGDFIEVSGSRVADGSIVASYVEREAPESEVELHGVVAELDATARTFTIGQQTVNYSGATLSPAGFVVANGLYVEVEGQVTNGILVARKVEREDDFDDASNGTEAEIEGLIREVATDRSSIRIDSTLVRLTASTVYSGGSNSDLVAGIKVEVKGVISADGIIDALKVEFVNDRDDEDGELEGAISAIDSTNRTITVLGTVVRITDSTVFRDDRDENRGFTFASLVVGDYVELGLSEVDGVLTATKIERDTSENDNELEGNVDRFDAGARTLTVSNVNIATGNAVHRIDEREVSAADFYAALRVGDEVEVQGRFVNGVFNATEIELKNND